MNRTTHMLGGLTLPMALVHFSLLPISFFLYMSSIFATFVPDLDIPLPLKHRGIFHQLAFWAIIVLIIYFLIRPANELLGLSLLGFITGIFSHLALDRLEDKWHPFMDVILLTLIVLLSIY